MGDVLRVEEELTGQSAENFVDKIRVYLEECDYFQGFSFIGDLSSGFSGITSAAVNLIDENFGKYSSILFSPLDEQSTAFNFCTSLGSLKNHSRISVIPLSMRSQIWDSQSPLISLPYMKHPSCDDYVFSAAINVALLSIRMKDKSYSLPELTQQLTSSKRMLGSLGLAFPLPVERGQSLFDWILRNQDTPFTKSLLPYSHAAQYDDSIFFQQSSFCGLPSRGLWGAYRSSPVSNCKDLLELSSREVSLAMRCSASYVPEKLNINCFPDLYDDRVDKNGEICEFGAERIGKVAECSVLTNLDCSTQPRHMLAALKQSLYQTDVKKVFPGLDLESFEESLEFINVLESNY